MCETACYCEFSLIRCYMPGVADCQISFLKLGAVLSGSIVAGYIFYRRHIGKALISSIQSEALHGKLSISLCVLYLWVQKYFLFCIYLGIFKQCHITKKLCRPRAGWDTNRQAASPLQPACLCPIFRCQPQSLFCSKIKNRGSAQVGIFSCFSVLPSQVVFVSKAIN